MSEDKEKPPIVIDGTRVVCPDHGIRGVKDCCGDNEPAVDPDEETGFDIVEAIKDLVQDPFAMSADEYNKGLFLRGALIDECGSFDFDKVARELTESLSHKIAVLQTEKGTDWLKAWINGESAKLEREFLYGPSGKPGPEPRGLLRADIVDPDPQC